MVSVKDAFAAAPFVAVTWMVKLAVPLAVGVPPMTPAGLNDKPAGSDPPLSVQVNGGAAPAAANVCAYFAETVPGGSVELVVMARPAVIERENEPVAMSPRLSATCTPKVDVPAVVGMPPICPVAEFSLRPAGRVPVVTVQV